MFQGYALKFNDMHGKQRSIYYFNIKTDGSHSEKELVSSVSYNYQKDDKGILDNTVTAFVRDRGQKNTYSVQSIKLAQEADFTVDSRDRSNKSYRKSHDINVNVVLIGIFPVPIL